MKAFFYTFGCKVNQYETENIKEAMLSEGYEVTEDYADAEVCVVNTCTVTAQSDSKCRQLIHKIKKANPECLIVLAGCFPQAFEKEASALDECGIIVGTGAKKEIPALIKRYITSGERIIRIVPRERGEAFEKMTNSGADQKLVRISKFKTAVISIAPTVLSPLLEDTSAQNLWRISLPKFSSSLTQVTRR